MVIPFLEVWTFISFTVFFLILQSPPFSEFSFQIGYISQYRWTVRYSCSCVTIKTLFNKHCWVSGLWNSLKIAFWLSNSFGAFDFIEHTMSYLCISTPLQECTMIYLYIFYHLSSKFDCVLIINHSSYKLTQNQWSVPGMVQT